MFTAFLLLPLALAGELPALPTTVAPEHRCAVEITAVRRSANHTGLPRTPAHLAWLDTLDPETLAMARGEDHAESHRLCEYAVSMAGGRWTWTETWQTTFQDLPEDWCTTAIPSVQASIQTSTEGCTWPARAAYWGHTLVPVDDVAKAFDAEAELAALARIQAAQPPPAAAPAP